MSIRAACACIVASLALVTGCGPDNAAKGGGAGGTVYYSNGAGEIWQLAMSTGETHRLFLGSDPDRTPEGAFIYTRASLFESPDGIAPRTIVQISSTMEYAGGFVTPRLSPDGTRIVYVTNAFDVVYVIDRADGALLSSFPPRDASVGFERPSWTPDGLLVVAGTFAKPGLFVSDAAFSTWTRLDPSLSGPRNPTVSPDGALVAFELNHHIFTIHLDGTGVKQVTTGDGAEEFFPVFSPDGASIAAYRNNPNTMIVVPTDGGTVIDLADLNASLRPNLSRDQFCWR
jgi:hypothetical protein